MDLNAASETICHSSRVLLNFRFNDIKKRYKVKKQQKLNKVFTMFRQEKMADQPHGNVKFFCKGSELFGHGTIESYKLEDKDTITVTRLGMCFSENLLSHDENLRYYLLNCSLL